MKKNKLKYVVIPTLAAATLFPVLADDNQAKANDDKVVTSSNTKSKIYIDTLNLYVKFVECWSESMDFDNIYEEYFDRVYYKVLSVVKNDDDAEDICQETFISVYKNLSKFREESNIYTWIYRIAINKTYDFFKKRKIEFEINDDVLSLPEDVNFDTKVILQEKLKLISDKEREIVILKDIYGYKLKEIAEMKNMNLSTVKSVYYKALKDMGGN